MDTTVGEARPARLRERAERAQVADTAGAPGRRRSVVGELLGRVGVGGRSRGRTARRTVSARADRGQSGAQAGPACRVHLLRRGVASTRCQRRTSSVYFSHFLRGRTIPPPPDLQFTANCCQIMCSNSFFRPGQ